MFRERERESESKKRPKKGISMKRIKELYVSPIYAFHKRFQSLRLKFFFSHTISESSDYRRPDQLN